MKKFRKKPVVIEAMQFTDMDSYLDICTWVNENGSKDKSNMAEDILEYKTPIMLVHTLEGTHAANPNDFIIKGVKGEYYPCKPDIFEMTYDKE